MKYIHVCIFINVFFINASNHNNKISEQFTHTITTNANTCIPIDKRFTPASLNSLGGKTTHRYILNQSNLTYLSLCSCPEVGLTSRDTSTLEDRGMILLTAVNTDSIANGGARLGVPTTCHIGSDRYLCIYF